MEERIYVNDDRLTAALLFMLVIGVVVCLLLQSAGLMRDHENGVAWKEYADTHCNADYTICNSNFNETYNAAVMLARTSTLIVFLAFMIIVGGFMVVGEILYD